MAISNQQLAYHTARVAVGVSITTHGAVRLPKLNDFAHRISSQYTETILSGMPSLAFAYFIPLAEVAVGLLIIFGMRYIRWGFASGIALMGVLMFGTCVIENWGALPSQLIHLLVFYILLNNALTPEPTSD